MSSAYVHHQHYHDRAHARDPASRRRKLLLAFVLTVLVMVVEVVGGVWSGSLALLADAGHMLVDALALLLAVVGATMAARPADARRSYGYGRMEVLVGFVNALSQFVLVGWIIYEAVGRLLHPGPILSGVMLVVALVSALLATAGLAASAAGGIMVGAALMMAAMFFTSVVFTFRDSYEPPSTPEPEPPHDTPPPDSPAPGPD